MTVLIVEDEKLNAEHLQAHIQKYGGMEVLAVLPSNKALQTWLSHNPSPDLLFSDIQLLDGIVFKTLEKGVVNCPVIFTTAYDDFYQEAFDSNGIAYLLKPVSYIRFASAMDKFFALKNDKIQTDWQAISELLQQPKPKWKERILVKSTDRMVLLSLKDVGSISTRDGICTATDYKGNVYDFRLKLADLSAELNPEIFFQINRGEIVNINHLEHIETFFNDRLSIKIEGQQKKYITSANKTAAFRKWLED